MGEKHQEYAAVPVFTGIDRSPTADQLKHLGASLASHGSMGMYHIVGVTPEARTEEDAFRDKESNAAVSVTDEDLENLYAGYNAGDRRANLVVFSAPQLSLYELKKNLGSTRGKESQGRNLTYRHHQQGLQIQR